MICNADLVYAYASLLPPSSSARSLAKRAASCSSISFYWALDRSVPALAAHNIFLADEYRESFDSIFKQHLIPKKPSFYVNVPSRVDPSAAPEGKEAVVVLVPVGHLVESGGSSDGGSNSNGSISANGTAAMHKGTSDSPSTTQDWPSLIAHARSTVLATILARTGVDLSASILHESVNTPPSWKEVFNLDRGAILGLSHSFFNVLSFRPKTKHPKIGSLYFVGASTHPGTGVPIVLAGAKVVSQQILGDLGCGEGPWSSGGEAGVAAKRGRERGSGIDEVQVSPVLSWVHWTVLVLLLAVVLGVWAR